MSPADPIERLVADWLGDAISPEDFRALDARLRTDPAARAALRRAANLDSALRNWATRHEFSAAWAGANNAEPTLAPTPARESASLFRPWRWPLAAAAALALSVATYFFGTLSARQPLAPGTQVLADGTVVELNGAAIIVSDYTATERRVRLERGEAHFTVTKDANRPFTVTAAGVSVRAVGTAFNVRLAGAAVEVLVTEGQVRLQPPPAPAAPASSASSQPAAAAAPERTLAARQRAVVATTPAAVGGAPEVATLTPSEIARVLAWQHRLLNFTATPLGEVVAALNRRNATQLVLADPGLAALRVSAALRSDNVHGFVQLLETGFGVRAEHRGDAEIVLSRPP
ncbi:MAG: FecR domain-containing protein [Opitutaceae bacterium]|nr:FecR domain-containing protein [Opitutaceae bacterium]